MGAEDTALCSQIQLQEKKNGHEEKHRKLTISHIPLHQPHPYYSFVQQDKQFTYNVTLRHIHVTTVAVEKCYIF